jgi:hypothetical protein
MGLTIHYSLKLPARILAPDIRQKLGSLRQVCLDLPFKEVGELREFNGEECDFEKQDREDPMRWFLIQSDTTVHFKYDRTGKPVRVDGWRDGSHGRSILPDHIVGFSTWPGEGCEEANIGLCRFPRTTSIPNRSTGKEHRVAVGDGAWRWQSFCKTQYANSPECGGLENFLRCHLTVVAMLDAAKKMGFEVDCNDEGGYWQKRDIRALVKEIGQWDAFIAGFAGALKDASEQAGLSLASPITERMDFERLEAAGQTMIPPGMGAALQRLVGLTAAVTQIG